MKRPDGKANITFREDTDVELEFIWEDSGGNRVDMTNYQGQMHVRPSPGGPLTLELTTGNGKIVIADQGTNPGEYKMVFDAADTDGLCDRHRKWEGVYDLVFISPVPKREAHQYGDVTIYPAITRP